MIVLYTFIVISVIFINEVSTDSTRIYAISERKDISHFIQQVLNRTKVDNTTVNISTYIDTHPISVNITTEIIEGDKGIPTQVEVIKHNGDLATTTMKLIEAYHDERQLSIVDYHINYTYASNKAYSDKRDNTYNKDFHDDYLVKCEYISKDITYNATYLPLGKLIRTVKFSFVTFGLIEGVNGSFYMYYGNNTIHVDSLDNYIKTRRYSGYSFNSSTFINLWLIDQPYLNFTQLVLQDKSDLSFSFYNVTVYSNFTFELNFAGELKSPQLNSSSPVKFGRYQDNLIIGTKESGIVVYKNETNYEIINSTFSYNNDTFAMEIKDLIINNHTMYVVIKGYGLVIYSLQDGLVRFNKTTLVHSFMERLDFFINPFLGSKYTGITIINLITNYEFFIELLIDDEFNPIINKVFTADNPVQSDNFLTMDMFYTYLYDKNSQRLIIIRRGMLNNIPTETYVLDLSSYPITSTRNLMFSLYDIETHLHVPVVGAMGSYLVIDNIYFPYDSVSCLFRKRGNFVLRFGSHGEVCRESLKSNHSYTSCLKIVNYNYTIYGEEEILVTGALIGISVGVFVLLSAVISFICWKTRCCRTFTKFKLKEILIERENIYKEAQSTAAKDVQEEDKRVHCYQLGTETKDGIVLGKIVSTPEIKGENSTNLRFTYDQTNSDVRDLRKLMYSRYEQGVPNLTKTELSEMIENVDAPEVGQERSNNINIIKEFYIEEDDYNKGK